MNNKNVNFVEINKKMEVYSEKHVKVMNKEDQQKIIDFIKPIIQYNRGKQNDKMQKVIEDKIKKKWWIDFV